MKTLSLIISFLVAVNLSYATKIIVDQNGAGQFTTIQAGINAAVVGDTVEVWPGTYTGSVLLNKSIILTGSGYESTKITGNYNPVVTLNSGIIQHFYISSLSGVGVNITGGTLRNCVISGCVGDGILASGGLVLNCVCYGNAGYGLHGSNCNMVNSICWGNSNVGVYIDAYTWLGIFYSNTSIGAGYAAIATQIGNISTNPNFISTTDFHITSGSPCWNAGQPSINDPDGTRSDMGYFGGPDAPIYPVVYEMTIAPNGSAINVNAKARANY